jgi:hypothetical protein
LYHFYQIDALPTPPPPPAILIYNMDYKQKSEEFRISIRRKNLNEKLAILRGKQSESYTL